MRSMTGYGQGAVENERRRISVSLRGVNHRYLDLSMRLREDQRGAEAALRELIGSRVWRGRVEISIAVESLRPSETTIEVREDVVERLCETQATMAAKGWIADAPLALSDLLRLPDVVALKTEVDLWDEDDQALLLAALRTALDEFVEAKESEGARLASILDGRLEDLAATVGELRDRRPAAIEELHQQIRARVDELAGQIVDADRLAQEVAILTDRSDVSEELDRLDAHFEHFRSVMATQDASVGKKLDFLAQEIHRELNTVGSKCRDSDMTRCVLQGKSLCEQLREQVQNVE